MDWEGLLRWVGTAGTDSTVTSAKLSSNRLLISSIAPDSQLLDTSTLILTTAGKWIETKQETDDFGYHNLAKMSSIAYTDGFYYVPRIDKEIIKQYKEDIIVLTGNLYGEVPSKVLNVGENQAEDALLWWKEQFGDDLYIELMRHNQEDENRVNQVLIQFARDLIQFARDLIFFARVSGARGEEMRVKKYG